MSVLSWKNTRCCFLRLWTRTQTGHGYRRSRLDKHFCSTAHEDMHERMRPQTWALTQTGVGVDATGHFVEAYRT
eukprot:3178699-Lingulodinium_polyedra.AAC.1